METTTITPQDQVILLLTALTDQYQKLTEATQSGADTETIKSIKTDIRSAKNTLDQAILSELNTNPEPEMIFINQFDIDKSISKSNNSLPLIQAIKAEYDKLLPNVPVLDTNGLMALFSNLDVAIDDLKSFWYDVNFGKAHKKLGVTKAKGFAMVDDQLPDFQPLDDAIMAFNNLFQNHSNNWDKYAREDAFEIVDNEVVISETYSNRVAEGAKVYLVDKREFDVRDTLNVIAENLIKLNKLVYPFDNSFMLFNADTFSQNTIDFNKLAKSIKPIPLRFEGDVMKFEHQLPFYRAFKTYLFTGNNTGLNNL